MNANGPFNPKNLFGEELPEPTPDIHEEIASVRDQLKKTRSELSNTRNRMERREREFETRMRVGGFVLVTTILSCAVLAAVLWYRVPLIRNNAETTGNPSLIHKQPTPVEAHADFTGQKPAPDLQERGKATQPLPGPAEPAAVRDSPADTNIAGVDKSIAIQPTNPDVRSDSVKEQSEPSHVHLLSDDVNRDRIDFEITRNKTHEVAPGIYLTIRNTNVELQRIDGWLQIAEDGRTVQIREQRAQTVVVFATKRDARNRELVFTRIDKSGAAGFLLIPTESNG